MVSLTSSSHVLVDSIGGLSWEGCKFNFRELYLVQLVAAFMDSLLTDVSQFKLRIMTCSTQQQQVMQFLVPR